MAIIMKIKNSLKDKDFLVKLFLCFGILFIGFILLVHFFFMNLSSTYKKDAIRQCEEKFIRNAREISDTLQSVYQNGIILLQDDLVTMNVKSYQDLTLENRLSLPNVIRLLRGLTTREATVLHAYLFADDEKVFLETGIYDRDSFYDRYHRYQDIDIQSLIKQEALILSGPSWLYKESERAYVMPLILTGTGTGITLVQDIEVSGLGGFLSDYSEEYQHFYLTYKDSPIWQSSPEKAELSYYLSSAFLEQEDGVVLQEDILYDIKAYCVIDFQRLDEQISEKYRLLTNVYIGFFVVVCVLIVGMSLRLYNPILNLKEILLRENKSEQNYFHRISLERILFYNKYPVSETEQRKLMESLFQEGSVCCAVVEIIPEAMEHNPVTEFENAQKYRLEEVVRNLLQDLLGASMNAYVIARNYLSYVAVLSDFDIEETRIQEAFVKVENIFRHDYSYCKIRVGIGEKTEDIGRIQHSYFLAETMAELYDDGSKFQVHFYQKGKVVHHVNADKGKVIKIDNIIKSGNTKALQTILEKWQEEMMQKKLIVQEQKQFWYTVFQRICKLAGEEKLDFYEITGGIQADSFAFGSTSTTENLSNYVEQASRAAEGLCGFYQSKTINMKERMNEVILYIQKNYKESIGLTEIADDFGISPHYLSRVFKNYTNVNLSSYIAQYRISVAKDLLLKSDKTVTAIAEEVGIMSKATFLRIFKNMVGVSPTEFRKIHNKTNQEEQTE